MISRGIGDLKKRHDQLFAEFKERVALLQRNNREREHFLLKVKRLIHDLEQGSENDNDVADFYWMTNAVGTWQLITSNLLGVSTNFSILEPPHTLRARVHSKEEIRFDEQDITKAISDTAYHIAEWRRNEKRIQKLIRFLGEDIPPGDANEIEYDWYRAERYFAFDVLKGEYDVARYACEAMFVALGQVWLRDVLELASYTIWEDKKKRRYPSRDEDMKDDYWEAQMWFYDCVRGANHADGVPPRVGKTSSSSAEKMFAEYINKKFLAADGHIDYGKESCRRLIERKAFRAWELAKEYRESTNWYYAEKFVELFYNNIAKAVTEPSAESKEKVRQAVEMSEDVRYHRSIIDCFEAASLMFFAKDIEIDLSRVLPKVR